MNLLTLRPDEIIVDSFAGGGGASLGISWALGRGPDVAINHDREAIAIHAANHPESDHHAEDVWEVDPVEACKGRPVGLMWASPDCKHFSKAKGGKPVSPRVRGLAWVVVRWAQAVKPRVIVLENVEEFQTWGPLVNGRPCPVRKGRTFRAFKNKLKKLGYKVEHRELRACDYGTPTIRKRLFLIARCDGAPIVWPRPTHGAGRAFPWRTAAECIDWSIPCPSIFERKRELAENTKKRIARGIKRFVIDSPNPFIVPAQFNAVSPLFVTTDRPVTNRSLPRGPEDPLPTVTSNDRMAVVAPVLAGVGGRAGQSPERPVDKPYQTITAKADAAVVATKLEKVAGFIAKHYGDTGQRPGSAVDEPLGTITTSDHNAVVAASIQTYYGPKEGEDTRGQKMDAPLATQTAGGNRHGLVAAHLTKFKGTAKDGQAVDDPLHTVAAGGQHHGVVTSHVLAMAENAVGGDMKEPLPTVLAGATRYAEVRAFLTAYFGNEKDGASLNDPMRTITARDRFALVTIDGIAYAIADIGMRMLVPRELYRAQGFPDSYRIEIDYNGKPLSKTAQVRMVGNSVCPPLAAAIVRAQFGLDGADGDNDDIALTPEGQYEVALA